MDRPTRFFASQRKRQQGSILVPAAFAILVGIILLGSAEIGWRFYMKREMQNAADLAALSAVRVMTATPSSVTCANAASVGRTNAMAQVPGGTQPLLAQDVTVNCAKWDQATIATRGDGLVPGTPVGESNAVRVDISKHYDPIIPIMGSGSAISATAIATLSAPSTTFTVGAELARTNPSAPLMELLGFVGLTPDVRLLSYAGVANATVTPSGLLEALQGILPGGGPLAGVDVNLITAAQAAAVDVTVSQLLDASAEALRKSSPSAVTADISALANALRANPTIGVQPIRLFSLDDTASLFGHIATSTKDTALQAGVNVLSLVSTAVETASAYALHVKKLNLLGETITVQAGIIEPPSIGVGGVGTMAYNAQVRVFVNIDTDKLAGGLLSRLPLGISARVHLPIMLDVARASAEITDIDCFAEPRTVKMEVVSSLVHACFVDPGETQRFSKVRPCDGAGLPSSVVSLKLPVLPEIKLLSSGLKPLSFSPTTNDIQFDVTDATVFPLLHTDGGNSGAFGAQLTKWLSDVSSGILTPVFPNATAPNDSYRALAETYLNLGAKRSTGQYIIDAKTVDIIQNGATSGGTTTPGLGSWDLDRVPLGAGLLGLTTNYGRGSVWTAYRASVTGYNMGTLDNLGGIVLGGLVTESCQGILSALSFNRCAIDNLASYMRTDPQFGAGTSAGNQSCGALCNLLGGVFSLLTDPLNLIGKTVVQDVLRDLIGIKIGTTEVHLYELQCSRARLVF